MLQRLLPPGPELDPDAPGARSELLAAYAVERSPHVRLNVVTSVDGRAVGEDGTSESLTTRTDRMLLGVIRQACDAVLVGAATVRAEGLGRPRRTPLVVLSASGDLTGHGFTAHAGAPGERGAPVLVVTTPRGTSTVARTLSGVDHEVIVVDGDDARCDPVSVIEALRRRGMNRIVVEGGPSLAASLLNAGLIDEICLTVVPRIVGSGIPIFDGVRTTAMTPLQLLVEDDGVQYGRWSLREEP